MGHPRRADRARRRDDSDLGPDLVDSIAEDNRISTATQTSEKLRRAMNFASAKRYDSLTCSKRASNARSGKPSARHRFCHCFSFAAPMLTKPSFVSKVSYGTIDGCRVPIRLGERPVAK